MAVFSMCSDIGAIIGPLVAGLLADTVSYPAAFGVGAAPISWQPHSRGGCLGSQAAPSKGNAGIRGDMYQSASVE